MAWTHTRAEIARTKKKNPDADVTDLRRKLKAERLADHVERALADLPPLTLEERSEIARILLTAGPQDAA